MQVLKKDIQEKIIEVALDEFLKYGYDKTTIRKIINKAEISIGNFYNYFKNKKDLFCQIVQPVLFKIENLKEGFFHFEEKKDFSDPNFICEFAALASKSFFELIKEHRKELVLFLDKNEGTPYANYKSAIIEALKEDFLEDIKDQNPKIENIDENNRIFYILAKNLIEGITEIAKTDNGNEELQGTLIQFFRYHFTGFGVFLKKK